MSGNELDILQEVVAAEHRPTQNLTRSQKYSEASYELIEEAAKKAKMPVGRFIRASAVASAKRVLGED